MLARLQQFTTLLILSAAIAWALVFFALDRPAWALLGAVLVLFGYALFLAAEFVLLFVAHADDPAPRASVGQLVRAWWGEVLTAPKVFCWRQPFRAEAIADQLPAEPAASTCRGVVLVHGFVCNRGFWNPWMQRLRAAGVPYIAVNLEPVFGSMDEYLDIVARAVERMRLATGRPPVIVAHSMGGLVARAWWQAAGDRSLLHRVITIGSPHQGTWLARFSWTTNGHQMRGGNAWLTQLAAREAARQPVATYADYTCFYSHCDNIVFPASTATLPGADNRHVTGVAHVHLAFQEAVFSEVLRCVGASATTGAAGERAAQ